ncbi:hypothetical protein [Bartonella harrusi]|uniref:Uncharacterized protein n=1 Tax=Bartonella harrusi TaxID=2961895 RepID=A0ABY5EYA2_9HYPH|nr:hypothetical protein [Bartonella harrusi]UTO29240.1 hypothetical protein NMK50_04750 [Bartonella harrusi]
MGTQLLLLLMTKKAIQITPSTIVEKLQNRYDSCYHLFYDHSFYIHLFYQSDK